MDTSGLVMASSTRPLLLHSPRSKHGAQARPQARPYAYGTKLRCTGSTHYRLFMFYLLYIDIYITLFPFSLLKHYLCIILGPVRSGRKKERGAGGRAAEDAFPNGGRTGPAGGRAEVPGEEVYGHASVHAGSWGPYRCSCATWANGSTSTSPSCKCYSYE